MTAKIDFTENQQKAIAHDQGHLRIIACAGSGKTEVISRRVAQLIKKDVSAKSIVAFTFTVKAAEEMKQRIRSILDEEAPDKADFGDMYIGTIDAFCFHILQELEPRFKNYDILDDAKRVAYVSKKRNFGRVEGWALRNYAVGAKPLSYYTTITRFLHSMDLMMHEEIDHEKLSNEHFKKGYIEYCKMLEEDRYLDFPSTIITLVKLLDSNPSIKKTLNDRIKHLVVDEYQDVNGVQERLIEHISAGTDSLCVVGDDDQCIYQWRGSYVDNIIGFKKRYEGEHEVQDIPLDINFRSTEAVIHTAREFIKNNSHRLDIKEMKSSEKLAREYEKGDIIHHHVNTLDEENQFILDKINQLKGTDFIDKKNNLFSLSLGDFAILVRTNADAARMVSYLESQGVDCIAYSGQTIFEQDVVLFAMDCLAYLFRCQTYNYQPTPTFENLKESYEEVFDKKDFPAADAETFAKQIKSLKTQMDTIFAKGQKDYLGDLGLQAVYHKLMSALGAETFDFGEVYNYNLAVLSTAISDYEAVWIRLRAVEIEGFFQFAQAYGQSNYFDSRFSDPLRIDAVKVMTIHKAKGLEFPAVFIPSMIKKRKPNPQQSFVDGHLYDKTRYNGTDEDERRTFYTAFTRSQKYLFITGASNGPRQKPYDPHDFIAELPKDYISEEIVLTKPRSGHPVRMHKGAIFATSFSELTTYDRCPHDYHLRMVYGFNAGVPAAFGYGTNIHNILNVIHNNYIRTKRVPTEAEVEKLIDKMFFLRYATDKITDNMRRGAKKIIKNYLKLQQGDFNRILETEKRFEFVIEDAVISGQIDLLKKVDEHGKVTEVEIIDFKTEDNGKEKPYELDYEKQLRLYTIACMRSLGLEPKKAVIHHLDKSPLNKKTAVDISAPQLEKTKEELKGTVSKILTKEFPAKPKKKLCEHCDYRYVCSRKGFKARK